MLSSFVRIIGLQPTHPGPNMQKRRIPDMKPFPEPCSAHCYMHMDGIEEKLSTSTRRPNDSNNEATTSEISIDDNSRHNKEHTNGDGPSTSKGRGTVPTTSQINGTTANGAKSMNNSAMASGATVATTTVASMAPSSESSVLLDIMGNPDAECEWTGSDQSLFRALHKVFLNNYCSIAQAMLTKTCQQVILISSISFIIISDTDISMRFPIGIRIRTKRSRRRIIRRHTTR